MKKTKEHLRLEADTLKIINALPEHKLDRTLIALKYMAASSIEDGKALAEYSAKEGVTLDMIVSWVREKQSAVAV